MALHLFGKPRLVQFTGIEPTPTSTGMKIATHLPHHVGLVVRYGRFLTKLKGSGARAEEAAQAWRSVLTGQMTPAELEQRMLAAAEAEPAPALEAGQREAKQNGRATAVATESSRRTAEVPALPATSGTTASPAAATAHRVPRQRPSTNGEPNAPATASEQAPALIRLDADATGFPVSRRYRVRIGERVYDLEKEHYGHGSSQFAWVVHAFVEVDAGPTRKGVLERLSQDGPAPSVARAADGAASAWDITCPPHRYRLAKETTGRTARWVLRRRERVEDQPTRKAALACAADHARQGSGTPAGR